MLLDYCAVLLLMFSCFVYLGFFVVCVFWFCLYGFFVSLLWCFWHCCWVGLGFFNATEMRPIYAHFNP